MSITENVRKVDGSKLWLPITLVGGLLVGMAAGGFAVGVWATGVSSKLETLQTSTDEIRGSLSTIADLAGQVNKNTGKLDTLTDTVAAQEMRVQTYITWLQTTQVQLAKQGFATPPLPQPKKGN